MLHILYRACNKELEYPAQRKERPFWFCKLKCFASLHNSIKNSKYNTSIKVTILMDGQESRLTEYINYLGYDINYYNFSSNRLSLQNQLMYSHKIKEQNIYFLEDDYLHLPNAIDILYDGVETLNLISGYDHMDRYTRNDNIDEKMNICLINNKHWRTAESTTCSWLVSRKISNTVIHAASTFLLEDRALFRYLNKNNNIQLYTPITGVTTHVRKDEMSPGVEWEKINDEIKL
jgi:hypothetical protein